MSNKKQPQRAGRAKKATAEIAGHDSRQFVAIIDDEPDDPDADEPARVRELMSWGMELAEKPDNRVRSPRLKLPTRGEIVRFRQRLEVNRGRYLPDAYGRSAFGQQRNVILLARLLARYSREALFVLHIEDEARKGDAEAQAWLAAVDLEVDTEHAIRWVKYVAGKAAREEKGGRS